MIPHSIDRSIGEISYFSMKIIQNPTLLQQYLKSPPYLRYFRNAFWEGTHIAEYTAGEYVLCQSTPPEHLYLMLSGRCCVRFFLSNGKSAILQSLRAPCLIGDVELFQNTAPLLVQALEKCRMLAIPLEKCRPDLLQDTHFLRQVCADLIDKERREALTLIHTFSYPLENRLAKFILDNRQENRFYIRKSVVAESLGASYRHVETVMAAFVHKGFLSKEKLVYTITDEKSLALLSQELEPFSGPWSHPPL